MLTCFIRTEFVTPAQVTTVSIFLAIPLCFVCYSIYLTILMFYHKRMRSDLKLKALFYKYIIYVSIYFFFNAPLFFLYILSLINNIEPNTFLSWLSYVKYPSYFSSAV